MSVEEDKLGAGGRTLCTFRGCSDRCGAQRIPNSTGRCSLSDWSSAAPRHVLRPSSSSRSGLCGSQAFSCWRVVRSDGAGNLGL